MPSIAAFSSQEKPSDVVLMIPEAMCITSIPFQRVKLPEIACCHFLVPQDPSYSPKLYPKQKKIATVGTMLGWFLPLNYWICSREAGHLQCAGQNVAWCFKFILSCVEPDQDEQAASTMFCFDLFRHSSHFVKLQLAVSARHFLENCIAQHIDAYRM